MVGQRESTRRGIWTEKRLQTWVRAFLDERQIVVLANREPLIHDQADDGSIVARRSAGGLVTAVEPIVRACRGTWVAHGSGGADRMVVDRRSGIDVPSADSEYRLRRVWLTPREQQGYYYGFANEALWPLCHHAGVPPVFRSQDFDAYRAVNARFAAAVSEEAAGESPIVLVQDYHFALAPHILRERLPLSTIVTFWHIPWPDPREFERCPWARNLLTGLLGSDIVGFQTPSDCAKFLETVASALNVRIDPEHNVITNDGRTTAVRSYPVSIEWPNRRASASPAISVCRDIVNRQFDLEPGTRVGVGVDRLDYTKGIEEKFLAVERLLEVRPDLIGRFVFVELAEPTRDCLHAYRQLRSRVWNTAERVNRRFGAGPYRPIVLLLAHHEPEEVYRFLRAADLCYVASLHDGMNLVAKEFVSARDDASGALVLSCFAGAAQQLTGALIVNPSAIDDAAAAMSEALNMPRDEQVRRMRRMRSTVEQCNAYWWGARLLQDAARVQRAEPPARVQSGYAVDARMFG
jgi:trehalose 6-phosphate synthase